MNNSKNTHKKVSVKEFADKYNPVLTRRGHKMSYSYLYRLIRQKVANNATRDLWFDFVMEGDKQRIYIILN